MVIQRFDAEQDRNQKFVRFVAMLMLCNGGTESGISTLDSEETVQARLMRFVVD